MPIYRIADVKAALLELCYAADDCRLPYGEAHVDLLGLTVQACGRAPKARHLWILTLATANPLRLIACNYGYDILPAKDAAEFISRWLFVSPSVETVILNCTTASWAKDLRKALLFDEREVRVSSPSVAAVSAQLVDFITSWVPNKQARKPANAAR